MNFFHKISQLRTLIYTTYLTIRIRIIGGKIGKGVIFKPPVDLYNEQNIEIGDNTIIMNYASLKPHIKGKIKIGKNCKINRFNQIEGGKQIILQDYVLLAPFVQIIASNHTFKKGTITRTNPDEIGKIIIEKNVWIGSGARILNNTTIGRNSVIGAMSIVNKNIPRNVVAVGIPAKVIKEIR